LELYSNYVLRNNRKPLNVFTFCDDHELSESDFYFYYANFDQLEADYLKYFLEQTLLLISAEESYIMETPKNKLLSFYFTFFEQLTLNRTLVIYLIGQEKNNLQNFRKLWALKAEFLKFIKSLGLTEPMLGSSSESKMKLERIKNKGIEEFYWGQFLATLKFWLDDTSSNFEKNRYFHRKIRGHGHGLAGCETI